MPSSRLSTASIRSTGAADASGAASAKVGRVAAAAEELAASIRDINQPVGRSANLERRERRERRISLDVPATDDLDERRVKSIGIDGESRDGVRHDVTGRLAASACNSFW